MQVRSSFWLMRAQESFGPASGGSMLIPGSGIPARADRRRAAHAIHADHSGGLGLGGRRVFSNALLCDGRHDSDFWLDAEPERQKTLQQSYANFDTIGIPSSLHARYAGQLNGPQSYKRRCLAAACARLG